MPKTSYFNKLKYFDKEFIAIQAGTGITYNHTQITNIQQKNCARQLFKNMKKLNYIDPLTTKFGVQI